MQMNGVIKQKQDKTRIRWFIPVFLGALFALGDIVAVNDGKLATGLGSFAVLTIVFSIVFVGLFAGCEKLIIFIDRKKGPGGFISSPNRRPKALCAFDRLVFGNHRCVGVLLLCSLIGIFWAPWFAALFPGVYWADTSQQLLEYYGLLVPSDHHPYVATLIFGCFADLGDMCFGSVSSGLFLLVLLQGALAVYFFGRLIWELHGGGLSILGSLLLLLFVSAFPLIPLMFCSLAKDTLSCVFFLGFVLQVVIVVFSKGERLKCPKILIAMLVFGLLAALTKKTAGLVVLLCIVFLAAAYRSKWNLISCGGTCALIALIVFIAFPRFVLPLWGVQPGGKQEAIATLIQQVAHDVTYNGDTLTAREREVIDDFLLVKTDEIPSRYYWKLADPIKLRGLNNDSRMEDFILVWADNTLKHPRGHLEAWLGLVDGWITFRSDAQGAPNYMVVLTYSGWHADGIEQCTDWNDQPTEGSDRAAIVYGALQSIPLLNILFFRCTWATILPFFSLFLLLGGPRCNRLAGLALIMPMLATLVPLSITPISAGGGEPTRYVFSIVCTAPFLIAALGASLRRT